MLCQNTCVVPFGMTAMVSRDEEDAALPSDGALCRLHAAQSSRRTMIGARFADVAQRFSAAVAGLKACATKDCAGFITERPPSPSLAGRALTGSTSLLRSRQARRR